MMSVHMGQVVKGIRESLNWSVVWLAEKSGVNQTIIYKMEKTGKGKIEDYERVLGTMGYEMEVYKKDWWGICG